MDSVAITLGSRPTAALVEALRTTGVSFNAYAEQLFADGSIFLAPEPLEIQVEVHEVGALGWSQGGTVDEVIATAPEHGLAPCSLEVALLLRLAWRERHIWPRIKVLSPRAHADETRPRGFYLRDDDEGCWLRGYVASSDWRMQADEQVALIRRSMP